MRNYLQAVIRGHKRRNAYRSLMLLDEHLLDDIGLTRSHIDAVLGGEERPIGSRKTNGHE
jgi:uncharacterized protein YjiS (DUF1127 family)